MGVYTEKLSAFRIECVRHIEDVVKAKGIDENCERVYKLPRPVSIYTKDETFGFRQESIVAICISVGVLHFIRDQKHRRYYIINDLDDEELANIADSL